MNMDLDFTPSLIKKSIMGNFNSNIINGKYGFYQTLV